MRYGVPDFYEWIDPFDMVERLVDEMNRREEEHENEAAFARQRCELQRWSHHLFGLAGGSCRSHRRTPAPPMFVRPK